MPFCPICSAEFAHDVSECPSDGVMLVATDPLLGVTLDGKYRLEERLGAGGMGAVYRATQIALKRRVAIKVVHGATLGGTMSTRRFEREAIAVARLKHPHIVAVHDYGVASGTGAYLVMELVDGPSLREELRRVGKVAPSDAITWGVQICSALNSAHQSGVVHRDLKPENIVLEPADGGRVAKVLDFGIAKIVTDDEHATPLTAAKGILGTPQYMSPEQCRGDEITPLTDIYSLGCVLYEMVCGEAPFQAENWPSILYQHISAPPPAPSTHTRDLPPSLEAAIVRALEKRPEDRFQSAVEFRNAILGAGAHADTPSLAIAQSPVTQQRVLREFANNLPSELSRFVGRQREIRDGRELLGTTRLLTLAGPGGIGKTRLAIRIASEAIASFSDGAWIVELGAARDAETIERAAAAVLGIGDERQRSTIETLTSHLRDRRLLLILDNCDHVVAPCATVVSTLLQACPGLSVIATSRELLGVEGETVWHLEPLPLGDPETTSSADAALRSDAIRLFVERASASRPTWRFADADAVDVARLCQRLDGIPLAIELAAARVRALSVRQILERLEGYEILSGGGRGAIARHQTLNATIEWSYDLLEPEERLLFGRVSVFAGGWTLDAAEAVCSDDSLEFGAVMDLLSRLVDKSLVVAEDGPDGLRYRLLETIRSYARAKLRESDDVDGLASRHRAWVLRHVEDAFGDFGGEHHERWHHRVKAEHDNVLAALEWGRMSGVEPAENLKLAVALGAYWETYGHWRLGRMWLESSLDAYPTADDYLRARGLFRLASLAHRQGELVRARELYEQTLALVRGTDRTRMVAETLSQLGRIRGAAGDGQGAIPLLKEALELHRQAGRPITVASALQSLGSAAFEIGDYDASAAWHDEGLRMFRQAGFTQGVAVSLAEIAKLELRRGNLAAAQERVDESLGVAREGDFDVVAVQALRVSGQILIELGQLAEARARLSLSIETARKLGAADDVVHGLESLAVLHAVSGDSRRALCIAAFCARSRREMNDPLSATEAEALDERLSVAVRAVPDEERLQIEADARDLALGRAIELGLGGGVPLPETEMATRRFDPAM